MGAPDVVVRETEPRHRKSMVAGIGHTLRTPLNSVLGFSELLLEEALGPLNERQRRYVRLIHAAGMRQLGLIDNLVDLARFQAGEYTLEWDSCPLAVVVREVVAEFVARAEEKGIGLRVRSAPDIGSVMADRERLRRVFANVLDNAVRVLDREGSIEVTVTAGDGTARVEIQDDGPGLPPELHELVFSGEDDLDATTVRRKQRSGTGLALCRVIVALHGGSIWIESSGVPGEGTTVVVELPIDRGSGVAG